MERTCHRRGEEFRNAARCRGDSTESTDESLEVSRKCHPRSASQDSPRTTRFLSTRFNGNLKGGEVGRNMGWNGRVLKEILSTVAEFM